MSEEAYAIARFADQLDEKNRQFVLNFFKLLNNRP